jgi:preprotein translocase subunit YajC
MNLLNVFLQAQPQQNGWMSILMMVLIFVVFYFFMIRPQTKKQKEIQKQRNAMKTGDKVVTAGGIYGKIKEVNETTILIEVADNVRIKVDKNSVYVAVEDAQQAATTK